MRCACVCGVGCASACACVLCCLCACLLKGEAEKEKWVVQNWPKFEFSMKRVVNGLNVRLRIDAVPKRV